MSENLNNKNIAVLMGGLSKERDISLKSGQAVLKALKRKGYKNVAAIDVGENVAFDIKNNNVDIAFNILHGRYGEDGCIQGLLECMHVPYTGSGVLGSAVSMSKVYSKKIFDEEEIKTAKYVAINKTDDKANIKRKINLAKLQYPLVVKPSCEGSTIGLGVVDSSEKLEKAVKLAFEHDGELVIEEFIKGKELTVAILGDKALPLVEIAPKEGIFDYKAKYTKGMTDYYVPARVDERVVSEAQKMALLVFDKLGCEGFARVDFILDEKGELFVLELNSIPGMTDTSLVPMAAKEVGIDFETLVELILKSASLKAKG